MNPKDRARLSNQNIYILSNRRVTTLRPSFKFVGLNIKARKKKFARVTQIIFNKRRYWCLPHAIYYKKLKIILNDGWYLKRINNLRENRLPMVFKCVFIITKRNNTHGIEWKCVRKRNLDKIWLYLLEENRQWERRYINKLEKGSRRTFNDISNQCF